MSSQVIEGTTPEWEREDSAGLDLDDLQSDVSESVGEIEAGGSENPNLEEATGESLQP